ncbi:MAG TPA: L,D-transpeptidase family protein [Blastocatellia bacterium]|nr:L,D-transpeptidase family protein [Blastocatellia bacterium]
MKNSLQKAGAVLALAIILFVSGCAPPPAGTNTNTSTNTNTTATTPGAKPVSATQSNVTLPMLDAYFAQDNFAGELKSKLQLSDDQINKLKTIAREETARLRESDDDDAQQGKTAAARRQAEQQIASVIGAEKTQQLYAFINEHSGGATASLPSTPGSVPTDTRIVVNAPAFRMDVFEGGKLVKTYRVGIGYPEFPLPTGLRKADTIIFNPTWTPPDEPWVESSNKVKVGETVEAGSKLNPLGVLKIPIGLPSLIHGGKSSAKIGTFASHGCVGLTDKQAQDFAKLLAQTGGASVTDAQIAEYQKNKTETKNVKLNSPIPVELRYETIAVVGGKLHIYRDVYDRGTNTEENLRAVLQANGLTLEQLNEAERAQVTEALKQMSRDATGKPATGESNDNSAKKSSNTSNRVTSTIKGQKEMVIEIAALAGKGYPAPVSLDTGGAKPEASSKAAPAAKRKSR